MSVTRIRMGAVLVGWLTSWFLLLLAATGVVAALLASGFDFSSLSNIVNNNNDTSILTFVMLFSIAFVSFFAGGYVAGRMAALSGITNGVMVIATSILFLLFGNTFLSIVSQKLGIDFSGAIMEAVSPYSLNIFVATLFAIAGSVLGGRLGEGYFSRLNQEIAHAQNDTAAETDSASDSASDNATKATGKAFDPDKATAQETNMLEKEESGQTPEATQFRSKNKSKEKAHSSAKKPPTKPSNKRKAI